MNSQGSGIDEQEIPSRFKSPRNQEEQKDAAANESINGSIEEFVQDNAFSSGNNAEIKYNSFDRKKNPTTVDYANFTSNDMPGPDNQTLQSPTSISGLGHTLSQKSGKRPSTIVLQSHNLNVERSTQKDSVASPHQYNQFNSGEKGKDDQKPIVEVPADPPVDKKETNQEFEDRIQERFYGVFVVDDNKYLFSVNSLHCMPQQNAFRKICVTIVVNRWFDFFITFCIIVNSGLLASKEYDNNYNAEYVSIWNEFLDTVDLVFTIIFLVECVLKIIAMGFVRHKKAYLRDAWNCIDFFIVVSSLVTLTPLSSESSLKVFRTARVLRPLRSMHQLQSMRSLLTTFFASIPGLLNVCLFQTFIFTIFAIIGVNIFQGKHYQFCRATEEPLPDGTWPKVEGASWQCSSDAMCSGAPNNLGDSVIAKCGDIYRDYQLDPVRYDDSHSEEKINFDITNFNNVLSASVTIFQVITLEGWTQLMYNYQDTSGSTAASIFFVMVTIIGAFVSLNLVLASIMNSYLQQEAIEKEKIQKEMDKIQKKIHQEDSNASLTLGEKGLKNNEQEVTKDKIVGKQVISGNDGQAQEVIISNPQFRTSSMAKNFSQEFSLQKQISNQGGVSPDFDETTNTHIGTNLGSLPQIGGQTMTRFNAIQQLQDAEKNYGENLNMNSSQRSSVLDQNNASSHMDQSATGQYHFKSNDYQENRFASPMPGNQQSSRIYEEDQMQKIAQQSQLWQQQNASKIDSEATPFKENSQIGELKEIEKEREKERTSIDNFRAQHNSSQLELQLIEEDQQAQIAETRSHKNCCFRLFYKVVISVTFNFLIYCFILANTITLALYRYDQSVDQEKMLLICDAIFVWVFTAELVAKLIGLGFKCYLQDRFNVFDAVIVVISLVDFTLAISIDLESASALMSAMRALRLLRVVKLARHWEAFQQILQALINSMVDISSFSVLLMLFIFIFALLGMEIFAYSVYFDIEGEAVFGQAKIQEAFARGDQMTWPRENFNNVFSSLLTVFIVVVAEDWNQVMYLYVRALSADGGIGRTLAQVYFLCLFILGNTIMLALFTALLLKSQDADFERLTEKIAETQVKKLSLSLSSSQMEDQDSNPFTKLKSKCSRERCLKSYNSLADSFVMLFGGETALRQRRENQLKNNESKDTNKIVNLEQADDADNNLDQSNSGNDEKKLKQMRRTSVTIAKHDFSQFVLADAIKDHKPLQRPVALLHYDTDQVVKIAARSKQRKEVVIRRGKSLFLFGPDNGMRNFCDVVSSHRFFEYFIILCILVSTINLAFEHPLEDPNSQMMQILNKVDLVFTGIFCVEALMKIIAVGFLFNYKTSYLLNSWNVLDFCIVVLSLVSLTIDADLSVVKVLRTARIMRPLRLIQHAEGLKVAIQALFKAIPQIMRLQFVVFFFMFMISILFTSLLSGKMFKCDLDHTDLSYSQQKALIANKWDCINYGGIWRDSDLNYDNTLKGMMSLFVFQTLEGWVMLMWDSVDAVNVNYLGVRDSNSMYVFLYLILVIVLALLFTNMFVSIVISTYNMEKDFLSFNRLLSDQQRSFIQVQIMTYKAKPQSILTVKSTSFIRNTAIKIAQSRYFDNAIILCIILNTIVMAIVWFDMDESISDVTDVLNQIFMLIFTLEAIIKIIAMKKLYFRDPWNIFDFTIVISTLVVLMLKALDVNIPFGNGPLILRALRIGRIFRLIKQAEQLQIIFNTLLDSAASQGSLGLLLIMSFFMFAIIGRSLFGLVKIGGPNEELNEHANFRDFGTSFLLLLRCSTGENWHLIMFEIARPYAPDYQCREGENYESMMENGGEPFACGSPIASYTFFILFNIFVFQIYINLFVAIMIDAFLGQSDQINLPVQQHSITEFVRIWSLYDPEATGYISIHDLDQFIKKLAASHESHQLVILHEQIASDDAVRNRFLAFLNIPTYDQFKKVMFYDVLQQLCYRVNLVIHNQEEIHLKQMEQIGMRAFGKGKDELSIISSLHSETAQEFNKQFRNIGRLNSKIKLMLLLQKQYKEIHDKYAIFVDTVNTISLDEQKRKKKNKSELSRLNSIRKKSQDDMNLYTTKHYYNGLKIIEKIHEIRQRRLERQSSLSRSPTKMLSEDQRQTQKRQLVMEPFINERDESNNDESNINSQISQTERLVGVDSRNQFEDLLAQPSRDVANAIDKILQ